MQKLARYTLALVVITLFLVPQSSQATGLGLYLPSWGNGSSTITYDYDDEFDRDLSHVGIGFVLDTRVARQGVFNYRLHLGFESADYQRIEKFSRFAIDNTFGFGVVQSRVLRLWLGPSIRLAYQSYSDEYSELSAFGFGLAPVLGMNFNIGNVLSICPEIGFRFTFFEGSESSEYYDSYYGYYDYYDADVRSVDRQFFINLAILFRIGDVFDDFF